MSFEGVRLLTNGRAELETRGPRTLSVTNGEVVIASANREAPVEIALGKATARTNDGVLRIERGEDFVSVGVGSGMAKIIAPDGTAQDLVAGQIATLSMGERDIEIIRAEVVDPFARMKISATERTKQRFKKVISKYFPDWQMARYPNDRRQYRGMMDMLSNPEEMYQFASYTPTSPLQLAQAWSEAAGEYYEDLFMPGNRAISIGRQRVISVEPGNAISMPAWSHDGTMIAYREYNPQHWKVVAKVVRLDDLEHPWVISQDYETVIPVFPMTWAPDNRHVLFVVSDNIRNRDGRNWRVDGPFKIKIAPIDPEEGPLRDFNSPFYDIPLSLPIPHVGKTVTPQILKLPRGDALLCGNWGNLGHIPIDEKGQAIAGAPGTFLTDFNPYKLFVGGGWWSPSGNKILFVAAENFNPNPLNVYILYDVEDILDGFAPPPHSVDDPRIKRIAISENPQLTGGFSFDESLVFYDEDVANFWRTERATSLYGADFDIFYGNALPDQPTMPIQIHLPGSQMHLTPSPDGNRIVYRNFQNGVYELRVVSFDIEADIDVDLGGVLIDNSGTNLIVPPGTLEENFGVTISTPFSVGEEAELTEGDNTFFAMRLLDAKGLDNPQFMEPMTLTIRYTDDEVAGLEEWALDIYYYDETDPENPVWVPLGGTVDPEYNEITVEIQHFSKFAVGGKKPTGL